MKPKKRVRYLYFVQVAEGIGDVVVQLDHGFPESLHFMMQATQGRDHAVPRPGHVLQQSWRLVPTLVVKDAGEHTHVDVQGGIHQL